MRTDADRVTDTLDAIAKIKQRMPSSLDRFLGDEMVQVWAIHHLQLIGEAGRCVSQSLRDRHTEVPWPQIIALRNILVHEYFGLNLHQVWTMVNTDLPELEQQIRNIHDEIKDRERKAALDSIAEDAFESGLYDRTDMPEGGEDQ
jgi:uncharacterized protein with HEPN domain